MRTKQDNTHPPHFRAFRHEREAMHGEAVRAYLAPFPITLIEDKDHKVKQREAIKRLTTRPAWRLADCDKLGEKP